MKSHCMTNAAHKGVAAFSALSRLILILTLMSISSLASQGASSGVRSKIEALTAMPDFAKPVDVAENACKALDLSLKAGLPAEALRAMTQMTIARESVSADSTVAMLCRMRSLCDSLQAPWSNLATLLEAKFLLEIYQSDEWDFDRRQLPIEEIAEDPRQWSGKQFAFVISDLCEKALADTPLLDKTPLKEAAPIVKGEEGWQRQGFSLLDFIAFQTADIYRDINEDEKAKRVIQALIAADRLRAEKEKSVRDGALFSVLAHSSNYGDVKAIENIAEYYTGTPRQAAAYGIEYLYNFGRFPDEKKKDFYATVKRLEKESGKSPDAAIYRSIMAQIAVSDISLNCPGQIMPGRQLNVAWESTNCSDFYILAVRMPFEYYVSKALGTSTDIRAIRSKGHVAAYKRIKFDDRCPYTRKDTVSLDALPAGYYALVVSATPTLEKVKELQSAAALLVSRLTYLADYDSEGRGMLQVIDGLSGAPAAGVSVTFKGRDSYWDRKTTGATVQTTTDASGGVEIPDWKYYAVSLKDGDNRLIVKLNRMTSEAYTRSEEVQFDLLTDLAIYKPGDTVECVAVASRCDHNLLSALAGEKVEMTLFDANNQKIASENGVCDASGRFSTSFTLPKEGMTGTWKIMAAKPKTSLRGFVSFEVAEYKAPTFKVTLERPDLQQAAKGEEIQLKGNVSTYSGMPLAGVEVNVEIDYCSFWWWSADNTDTYNFKAVTDAEGNFQCPMGSELLKSLGSGRGLLKAEASATSGAGETRSSESLFFSIGEHYAINADIPSQMEVTTDSIVLNVKVVDALGNPARQRVTYNIKRIFPAASSSETAISGDFESPALPLEASRLPSGTYEMTFRIADDTVSSRVIIWRPDDRSAPTDAAVWTPRKVIYAEPGASKVRIPVGTAWPDARIYMKVETTSKDDNQKYPDIYGHGRWLAISDTMEFVEVDAPTPGNRLNVRFIGIHDLGMTMAEVRIRPAYENVKMTIVPTTFRDRLLPGHKESWSFDVKIEGTPASAPAKQFAGMAVMSNAALDAITPFRWIFNPLDIRRWSYAGYIATTPINNAYNHTTWRRAFGMNDVLPDPVPYWMLYDRSLYSEGDMSQRLYYSTARSYTTGAVSADDLELSENAVMMDMAEAKAAPTLKSKNIKIRGNKSLEASDEEAAEESAEGGNSAETPKYRAIECPLAFFQPMLASDDIGILNVNFEVPDFNTTWRLQLAVYDPSNMLAATADMTAVASKPVMVAVNAPRFLRTGDHTTVAATVFNNNSDDQPIGAVIEIFDVVTGEIYASRKYPEEELAASASRIVEADFTVPQYINAVGIRCRAFCSLGSDGEQTAVSVLPATQPMLDATTFYIPYDSDSFETRLPKMRRDDRVTLEYCDNPEWYVLTSLSPLVGDDKGSALSIADALCANSVGSGILGRNPHLRDSLREVIARGDSAALTSPLQLNEELKITTLGNTPWVNNAQAETWRMRNIYSLADSAAVKAQNARLLARLTKLQTNSGGWSWWENMPPSLFITEEVLWRFAAMKTTGDLPDNADGIIRPAIGFCDREIEEIYDRQIRDFNKYTPSWSDVEYFFIRGRFDTKRPAKIEKIHTLTLAMLEKGWRDLDVTEKCMAAVLLFRDGRTQLASEIMESVSQFASYTPQKGMWFDGATAALSRTDPVISAAVGLMAYREIDPQNIAVERLRQYLLLSRQTQDWQLGMSSSKAVMCAQAVLGADDPSQRRAQTAPQILIDGRPLDISEAVGVAGAFTLQLEADKVSGRLLTVKREKGVPAWGGVICQYEAPLKDVKARGMEQLNIERAYYPVITDSLKQCVGASTREMRVGQRIRVTLTITTDRDLDYVIVCDSRGACMEPREQLTQYVSEDGLIYVRESRNTATNLYFYRVQKGIHIVSYEIDVDRRGSYSAGSATSQCLYYPLITARTAAALIEVK